MERIKKMFDSLGVEYYSIISFSHLIKTKPYLAERQGIEPKTAIIYLLPYYGGECQNISRYAASRDYHIAIREIGEKITSVLDKMFPGSKSVSFGDHSPIDERHAALISGLGIAGDNGLLINERYGSYVFIGDVLTDIPPSDLGATDPIEPRKCEGCGACRAACPTGILRGDGEDCLSAITQKKGELAESEKALMRKYNTAWGCDLCQSSCPHNSNPKITPIRFFLEDRITALTESTLSSMSDEELSDRAFSWRGRKILERNVNVLLKGNNADIIL